MIQENWDKIAKKEVDVERHNPAKPEYPIKTTELRIRFKHLFAQVLPAAKEDGCIFIPYEETTEAARQKKQEDEVTGNIAADHDPMAAAAAAAEANKD